MITVVTPWIGGSLLQLTMTDPVIVMLVTQVSTIIWLAFRNKTDCDIFGEVNDIPLMENMLNPIFLKDGGGEFVSTHFDSY